MISPIELTAEQRQDIYNQKAKRFMDGMQKLNEETGLHLIPIIQYTAQGNMGAALLKRRNPIFLILDSKILKKQALRIAR